MLVEFFRQEDRRSTSKYRARASDNRAFCSPIMVRSLLGPSRMSDEEEDYYEMYQQRSMRIEEHTRMN